jgi:hypothetical protein
MNPMSNGGLGFGEIAKVNCHTHSSFFLETTKETFDEVVLLARIRRNELLAQRVIAAGCTKTKVLKDESIVTPNYRCGAVGTQRAEVRQAGLLKRRLSFLRAAAHGECETIHFAVMTINHGGQMAPTRRLCTARGSGSSPSAHRCVARDFYHPGLAALGSPNGTGVIVALGLLGVLIGIQFYLVTSWAKDGSRASMCINADAVTAGKLPFSL